MNRWRYIQVGGCAATQSQNLVRWLLLPGESSSSGNLPTMYSSRPGATSHASYVEHVQLQKSSRNSQRYRIMLTSSHLRRQSSQRDDLVQERNCLRRRCAGVGHVSANGLFGIRSRFGAFVSAGKISFPGNRRLWFEETRFDCVIIEQEVRAIDAGRTIPPASRRDESLPCHGVGRT
jgi:hypothetical protein